MRGWFDGFRQDGGPTLYAYSNRTSVTGDVPTITICLIFLIIFVAFLLIFPGVRKERLSTFCTVTLTLLTGTVIYVCNFGSDWHVASGEIVSSYRAFSRHKIYANLAICIGLGHANVSLHVIPTDNQTLDINFNERFHWNKPNDMMVHYKNSLAKGLPYPILTVAEYLAVDSDGFTWGRYYRTAGYYTTIVLWSAFACWCLMVILLLNVPRYGAYMMIATGFMMGLSCAMFWFFEPTTPLHIRFEYGILTFHYGWCFWLVLVNGCIITAAGIVIALIDLIYPHNFSTILEVDFDTPYDRHIIIEDSLDTRKRRFKIPKLEEPLNAGFTVGSILLRRLSKRGKDGTESTDVQNGGIDNMGFELEHAKTGWRAPANHTMRSDSKKSQKSTKTRTSSQKSQQHFLEIPHLDDIEDNSKILQRSDSKQSNGSLPSRGTYVEDLHFPPIKRQDSSQSCASSSSSYGLGFLSRVSSIRKTSGEEYVHHPVSRTNSGNIIVFNRTDSRGQLHRAKYLHSP